ncbi:MAG: hypothetical protein CL878_15435 [Dehalococcoidia bacterium]|nr:hypothetical protein [Dehalococcoidia bacterium]
MRQPYLEIAREFRQQSQVDLEGASERQPHTDAATHYDDTTAGDTRILGQPYLATARRFHRRSGTTMTIADNSAPAPLLANHSLPDPGRGRGAKEAKEAKEVTPRLRYPFSVRWTAERGWLRLRDPFTGEWHQIRAAHAPPHWAHWARQDRW